MKGWRSGLVETIFAGALGAGLLGLSCGNSSGGSANPNGSAGSAVAGGGGNGSGGGAGPCQGTDCASGGAATATGGARATQACRDYFAAVCARITDCGAPRFRPCESPIDVCPDILFSEGSAWTVPEVLACTEEWKKHDCTALKTDQGPACSQVLGKRPLGGACVFDAQCQNGHCLGGVTPAYQATCGVCADYAPSHGACDEQHVCRSIEYCEAGTCVDSPLVTSISCSEDQPCPSDLACYRGLCVPFLPLGAQCTYGSPCAAGLGCGIELGLDPEAEVGTCQPLPPVGQPCLPTFSSLGLCVDGGTCDSRPTGDCVPLVEIGQACGFTSCVAGAYCQVQGYSTPPSHICYALGNAGDACPHEGSDHGNAACAEDLFCLCPTAADCTTGVCGTPRAFGQSCNGTSELCEEGLLCSNGTCAIVRPLPPGGELAPGTPCTRSTTFGREASDCIAGLDCLCADATCAAPVCATPRDPGETCGLAMNQICRQGLSCTEGKCAFVTDRGIEAQSCMSTLP